MTLRTIARTLLVLLSALILSATPASAAESPSKRDARGLPKGSYATSCTCQLSGGVDLSCFCANLHAKWFRTAMDVRTCEAPKDIKNCEGILTCTGGAAVACPGEPLPPKLTK